MSKSFSIAFGIGLLVTVLAIGAFFYARQGKHLAPRGSISSVRIQDIDESNSLAVLDLRLVNDSDENLLVRDIATALKTKDGHDLTGATLAASDAKSVFHYYPHLGTQTHEPLREQDRVLPHQTIDRMLAVRFQAPASTVQEGSKITVRITDELGPVAEFSSAPH